MSSLKRRLQSLECEAGKGAPSISVIIRRFMRPGPNGPVETGLSVARICNGSNANSHVATRAGESSEGFERCVEQKTTLGATV